jgi:hypothetical protein
MTEFQAARVSQVAQFGEISLDFGKMELCRADRPIVLTLRGVQSSEVLSGQAGTCRVTPTADNRRLAKAETLSLAHCRQLHPETAAEDREQSGLPRFSSNRSRGWLQVCSSRKAATLLAGYALREGREG